MIRQISEKVDNHYESPDDAGDYDLIKRYSWEQKGSEVIFSKFEGLEGVDQNHSGNITCTFENHGFDLRVRNWKGRNLRMAINTPGDLDECCCKYLIDKDGITIKLTKRSEESWTYLMPKEGHYHYTKKFLDYGVIDLPIWHTILTSNHICYVPGDN